MVGLLADPCEAVEWAADYVCPGLDKEGSKVGFQQVAGLRDCQLGFGEGQSGLQRRKALAGSHHPPAETDRVSELLGWIGSTRRA